MTASHTLPFPARRPPPAAGPDVAVAALPLFARTRDTLTAAARFRARCRVLADRWHAPPAVFLGRPAPQVDPLAAHHAAAARRDPAGAQAWAMLPDLVDDVLCVLDAAPARHAARAAPGFAAAVAAAASESLGLARLAETLALVDDEVVRVTAPATGATLRLLVRGVATVGDLLGLVDECAPAGTLPTPCVRLAHPRTLATGRDPAAVAAAADWFWPEQPLARLPRVAGERVVLAVAGEFAHTAGAGRAEVEVLTVTWPATGRRAA